VCFIKSQLGKVLLRGVTIELPLADLKTFDPASSVQFVEDAGANMIVAFALGYLFGETYYPSSFAPPHPDLRERDVFGAIVKEAKDRGLMTIVYVNTQWAGQHVSEAHPDWVQRRRDGSPTPQGEAVTICPNSPYADTLVSIIAEIGERYPVDGFFFDEPSLQSWCACPQCQARYRAETGRELPTKAAWGTSEWREFLEFRTRSVSDFVKRLHAVAKKARPGCVVFSQYHFPMSTPALDVQRRRFGLVIPRIPEDVDDWYRPTFYAERLEEFVDTEDIVSIESYRRSVDQPVWWVGATVNHGHAYGDGKPVLMLTEYPQFPWSLTALPEAELQVAIADIVANGGNPWLAWYGPGVGDARGWEAIGRMYRMLGRAEENLVGLTSAAGVALLHSRNTADGYGRDRVADRYLDEVLGWYQALMERHIPVSVISDAQLTPQALSGFKAVVLPNSACVSAEAREALAAYVEGGGGLVATYEAGLFDAGGEPLDPEARRGFDALFGISRGGDKDLFFLGYIDWQDDCTLPNPAAPGVKLPYRDDQLVVTLDGGEVQATYIGMIATFAPIRSGAELPAAVVTHETGSGRTVYFAGSLGKQYYRNGSPEVADALASALRWAAGDNLPVKKADAPPTVSVNVWKQPATGRTVVFLTNFSNTLVPGGTPAVIPVHDIKIRLSAAALGIGEAARARSAFSGKGVPLTADGDTLELEVGRVDVLEAIIIDG